MRKLLPLFASMIPFLVSCTSLTKSKDIDWKNNASQIVIYLPYSSITYNSDDYVVFEYIEHYLRGIDIRTKETDDSKYVIKTYRQVGYLITLESSK